MARKAATNYYHMLGVKPEVTALEIKQAYRKLAKDFHPDVKFHGKSDSQREQANVYMARLNEAYETLIDKSRRANYDSILGVNGEGRSIVGKHPVSINEEEERELYLRMNFNPARGAITRIIGKYKQQLIDLSQIFTTISWFLCSSCMSKSWKRHCESHLTISRARRCLAPLFQPYK